MWGRVRFGIRVRPDLDRIRIRDMGWGYQSGLVDDK